MGNLSSLKLSAACILAAMRKRGEARQIAERLNLASADRVRDWAREEATPQNEYATGRPCWFDRWLNHFSKLFDRAERQLEAENLDTAFALMEHSNNCLMYRRFWAKGVTFTGKDTEIFAFQIIPLSAKLYRFISLSDAEKARAVLIRLRSALAKLEYSLYQPENANQYA